MCEPVSAGIALAAGLGASLYGGMQQSKAAQSAAQAVADQNRANQQAQQTAFTTRNTAAQQQVQDQLAANTEGIQGRTQVAQQYFDQQRNALKQYQEELAAQNQTATSLRQTGDTAAKQLLDASSAENLQIAQDRRRAEAQALLEQGQGGDPDVPGNPDTSAPGDSVTQGAVKARLARAATNIRNYGSRVAQQASYAGPTNQVGLNVADAAYGIMPARAADELLRSGSSTRLLPTKVAYRGAQTEGKTADILGQLSTQDALTAAGLSYGNAVDIANLKQSNEQTTAANIAAQAKADAEAKKASGAMISSLGNLAMYGAGYFGGPSLSGLFSGSGGAVVPDVARSPLSPLAGIARSPLSPLGGGFS